jgi:hypothetical protein
MREHIPARTVVARRKTGRNESCILSKIGENCPSGDTDTESLALRGLDEESAGRYVFMPI